LEYLPPFNPDANSENVVILIPTTAPPPPPPVEPVVDGSSQEAEAMQKPEMPFWDFRESIPGEPESDYPIFDRIPKTSFTCQGRLDGYYADVETRCQAFHVCITLPNDVAVQNSFLCPNGTLFNQEGFVCQWWADVDCASSDSFFKLNANIGIAPAKAASSVNDVRQQPAIAVVVPSAAHDGAAHNGAAHAQVSQHAASHDASVGVAVSVVAHHNSAAHSSGVHEGAALAAAASTRTKQVIEPPSTLYAAPKY